MRALTDTTGVPGSNDQWLAVMAAWVAAPQRLRRRRGWRSGCRRCGEALEAADQIGAGLVLLGVRGLEADLHLDRDLVGFHAAPGLSGEVLEITATRAHNGYKVSDLYEASRTAITTNGEHAAVRVGDVVFDNLNRSGVPYDAYIDSLHTAGGGVADGAIKITSSPF